MRWPFGDAVLAALIRDWAGEDLVGSGLGVGDDLVGGGAHVFGHVLIVGRHAEEAFFEAPPDVVRLP